MFFESLPPEHIVLSLDEVLFTNFAESKNSETNSADLSVAERLLLKPRIGEERFSHRLMQHDGDDASAACIVLSECLRNPEHHLEIMELRTNNVKEIIEKVLPEKPDDWKRIEDLEGFLNLRGSSLVLINEEKKCAIVVFCNPNDDRLRLIACLLPRLLPWYFEEKPLDKDETLYLVSMIGDSFEEYVKNVEVVMQRFDVQKQHLKLSFRKMAKASVNTRKRDLDRKIALLDTNIGTLMSQIAEKSEDRRMYLLQRHAMESGTQTESNLNDMFAFLDSSKNVEIAGTTDRGSVIFCAKSDLVNYPDAMPALIANKRSALYQYATPVFTEERLAKLMKAIFIDEELTVRMGTFFEMNPSTLDVRCARLPNAGSILKVEQRCENPHHANFHCLGDNGRLIAECMTNLDYVGMLNQMIVATGSMNLLEIPTFRAFMLLMVRSNEEFIQLPDGRIVTPLKALQYLEEREEENKEHE